MEVVQKRQNFVKGLSDVLKNTSRAQYAALSDVRAVVRVERRRIKRRLQSGINEEKEIIRR